jgi:hypothetical protein
MRDREHHLAEGRGAPITPTGAQGWEQFLASKHDMLYRFELAQRYSRSHRVRTWQGTTAEAVFREWLSQFLPKRFGVSAGRIISQGKTQADLTPHYDVVIYDQVEASVLWIESNPDRSHQGRTLAVPAEYVHGVLEVKATLTAATAAAALRKLEELRLLTDESDPAGALYPQYLPANSILGMVFFQMKRSVQFDRSLLNRFLPRTHLNRYYGALILGDEGLDPDETGMVRLGCSDAPTTSTVGRHAESLLTGMPVSDSVFYPDSGYHACYIDWSKANFAHVAFDLVAAMKGRFRHGYASSLHATPLHPTE